MKTILATLGWMLIWAIAADTSGIALAQAETTVPEATAPTEAADAAGDESTAAQLGDVLQAEPLPPTDDQHAAAGRMPERLSRQAGPSAGDPEAHQVDRPVSLDPRLDEPLAVTAGDVVTATEAPTALVEPAPLPELIPPPDAGDLLESDEAVDGFTIELTPLTSPVIPADRRSTVRLGGRVLDPEGNPVPRDVVVTLTTAAGEFLGVDYDGDRAGFQVLARQGEFAATLQSNLEAQTVRIRAAASGYAVQGLDRETVLEPLPEVEAFTQVEFVTNLRPSLVSGVVDLRIGPGATNFWGSYADFLNPDEIGETEFDLGAALFATGTLGDWQFTGALNTRRALNETCNGNRLFRDDQFCENAYPVYGDSSQVDYLTPSIDSFYVRFQRDSEVPGAEPDYFMWGDYTTQEFSRSSQDFTAVIRQLHGFKGNYTLGNFQLTAMYANNLRPFQRDTIAPDGTSGYYFLSRRLILPGSENVFLETEELLRPGTVIERRQLNRVSDYEIDYDRGTLLFRQPIFRTEIDPLGKTLVRQIVVTYQVDATEGDGNLYAGRLQYTFKPGDPTAGGWAGITYLLEDQGDQDFSLYGVDVLLPLGETGSLAGEFARSSFDRFGRSASGNAYRLEAQGFLFAPNVEGRAYLRSAESGFSNVATTSFRPGQTRWGAGVVAHLSATTRLNAQFDQEINRGQTPEVTTDAIDLFNPGQYETPGAFVDNTLTTYRAGIWQAFGSVDVGLDWVNRDRRDRLDNTSTSASQLVPRLAIPLTPGLSFQAQSEINIGSEADALYPDRTILALDWDVQPGVTMRLAQQFLGGGLPDITSLDTLVDYELGDNTSLRSRYSLIGGYGGLIGQAALGLNHRLVLAPGLRASLGFEHVVDDAFRETGAGQQFIQPYAVGTGASALGILGGTSYYVGVEYTNNPDFQASARIEHRHSAAGNNTVFTAAAAGKISPALTTLFRYEQANFANQRITGILGDSIDLKLGMAYRNPISDQWNALLSYEYRRNPATTPDSILFDSGIGSSDHTLSLEAIYAPTWQWEFYGKYAFRISDANLADDFSFSNSLHLMQFRTAYRFAYRWDILGEVRYITQPQASFNEIGTSIELGYYLTPDLRLGVGYSFGSVDNDGFGGGYRSASGPYLGIQLKVNELLNGFGLQPVVPPQQEESLVDTATGPTNDAGEVVSPAAAEAPDPAAETVSEPTSLLPTTMDLGGV